MDKLIELLLSDPETAMVVAKSYIEKYKPLIYSVAGEFQEILRDLSNNTELASIAAKASKNQFDAYVAAGFSEEQAMALLLNDKQQLKKIVESGSRR